MGKKLSKIGWLIIVGCIVLAGGVVCAKSPGTFKPDSEPDGFRGIKWGQDISTVDDLVFVSTDPAFGGIDLYVRKGDEMKMGGAELDRILYGFWKDKLSSVIIYTKGYVNWDSFKAVVFEKFGKGYQGNKYIEEYVWGGEKAMMMLDYNEFSKEGMLLMWSKEISIQQEEWKEQQAKKGAEEGW